MTKRQREIQFQVWLDPKEPYEEFVIKMLDYMIGTYNDTKKTALYKAFAALNATLDRGEQIEVPKTSGRQMIVLSEIKSAVDTMMEMLRSGRIVADDAGAQAFVGQLNEIERAISDNYRPMTFGEENDG